MTRRPWTKHDYWIAGLALLLVLILSAALGGCTSPAEAQREPDVYLQDGSPCWYFDAPSRRQPGIRCERPAGADDGD